MSDTDSSNSVDPSPIIIDNGADMISAGWAAEDSPRVMFPTLVGVPKHKLIMIGMSIQNRDHWVGDQAHSKRTLLNLTCPMKRGVIINIENMQKIWHHTFYNELHIIPKDEKEGILMTITPFISKLDREKITKIMFETFNINRFSVEYPSKLALYCAKKKTGIVLQSGKDITYSVPIYNGKCILNAIQKVNIGGKDITKYLAKMCKEKGYLIPTHYPKPSNIPRDMKEKYCYIANNYENECKIAQSTSNLEKNYELPDGMILTLNLERFKCCEALFKPNLIMDTVNIGINSMDKLKYLIDGYLRTFRTINIKLLHMDVINIMYKYLTPNGLNDGIHKLIYRSIMKCDINIRKELFENIILSGGNTMFKGINNRLKKELELLIFSLSSVKYKVNVIAPPERKYGVWIGGSLLCKASNVNWITKNDYNQYGATIVHKKCLI